MNFRQNRCFVGGPGDSMSGLTLWRLAVSCVAIILALVASGCAGLVAGNKDATTPLATYTLSGAISPTSGGNGATLTLTGASTATVSANSSGAFSFSSLANGTYVVTPTHTGFTFSPTSTTVTISGANVTGVNFTDSAISGPTYSISGTISPAAGGNGATVTLSGASSATTVANSSGAFTFTGLANGSYTVTPTNSGYTFAPASQSVVVNGANVTGINFTDTATSAPTYTVSGTISPTAGGSGATVTLSGAASGTTIASASGTYSFTGLANGSYTVTPTHSGYTFSPASQSVTVSGANATGVNFTATAVTYTISGTISPTAGGNGATVTLSGAASATTTASASGTYSFTTLANGSYTITPSKTGYTFAPGSQSVTVNGANLTGVNFTDNPVSTPTYSVSGTISPTAGGNGATVTLSGAASGTTTASASGTYSFTNLPNGSYTVTPSKSGYSFAPGSQSVTVNGANVTGINFTDTAVTYTVSGTISPTAGGNGATVTLSGAASATTTASASGAYSFAGLTNGSYTVTPSNSGYTFTPGSQSVTVNGANVSGVNFTDTAVTYTISGTISPTAGGNGATVTLSGAASTTTTASASGTYSFTTLANGSYTVTPSKSGYTFTPASQSVTINGANATGVNFTDSAPTYTVSGTVSPTAGGSGATVTLSGAASATTTASASGTYSFTGLAAGSYTITPTDTGYTYAPSSQNVTVSTANVTGVNFTASALPTSFTISGAISPTAGGSGATVTLSGASSATTTASASGTYSFTGLANGSYTVTPSSSTGYTFAPTNSSVTVSNANVNGVNFTASLGSASTTCANTTAAGWCHIPNLNMANVCPNSGTFSDIQGAGGCLAVVNAWSGGAADTNNNRLVYCGGGHGDYGGNECYSLNLADNPIDLSLGMNPTYPNTQISPAAPLPCTDTASSDSLAPNSRHTYNGIVFLPSSNQMTYMHGSLWCASGAAGYPMGMWLLNLTPDPAVVPFSYTHVNYTGTPPGSAPENSSTSGNYVVIEADYDPNTNNIFAWSACGQYHFALSSQVWTKDGASCAGEGSQDNAYFTPVVDPQRKKAWLFGGTVLSNGDISGGVNNFNFIYSAGSTNTLPDSTCNNWLGSSYAGAAYNSKWDRFFIWDGDGSVYIFDPNTLTCTTAASAVAGWSTSSDPGAAVTAGTFGRFRYFPGIDKFGLVNYNANSDQDPQDVQFWTMNAPAPQCDWGCRSTATGVVQALPLSSAASITGIGGTVNNSSTGDCAVSFDTSIESDSGQAVALFSIGANPTGDLNCNISFPMGQQFGEGTDFYYQWQEYWDANFLANSIGPYVSSANGGEGLKHLILYANTSSSGCASIELMHVDQSGRGYPQLNTDCGSYQLCINNGGGQPCVLSSSKIPSNDALWEQGMNLPTNAQVASGDTSYNCYNHLTNLTDGCANWQSGVWMTFYCHQHTVTWGASNGPNGGGDLTTKCWIAFPNQPMFQYINMQNYSMAYNQSTADKWANVEMTPYDTQQGSVTAPAATKRYANWILSTSPIPPPYGLAPDNQ
jgi:hypothetical protein